MINWKTAIYGNRVRAKDYEGYLATNPKVTTYIGNYFEVQVEGYVQPTGGSPTQTCRQTYCAYFPYVANIVPENVSYYYADGERIAMKNNGLVSYLYGDQLGSISAIADVNGNLASKTLYHPWGTTRYTQGTYPTNYAYTGQMREGDIYYYNARWYDPAIGRFMQADTIVPMASQGTQAFDRYAYVNNNPLRYTDPSGNYFRECGDDHYQRCGTIPPPPPTYNVFVCGVYDGNNCGGTDPSTPLYPYYSWPGANAYFDVDQYGTKANTFNAIEEYLLRLPKTAKLRFIGHSAGADTIILELNRLRESQSLSRVLGTVILDPTLTASPYFLETGDLSGILIDIILSNTPIFIGTTEYMEKTHSINLYIPATNYGGAENYYYDDAITLSHQDLALSVEIANKAWRILQGE